ncbi:MAG TPA: hypothetical protein EYN91_24580 [Candidatus Melainabacteria bacterium]|nr:hypothetical protein [Candidatus Melainabacteria bacterium]
MNKGNQLRKQTIKALFALFLTLAPMFVFVGSAIAQTREPTLSDTLPVDPGVGNLSPGAQQTQNTVPGAYADAPGEVPLVYTAATNNTTGVIQNVTNTLLGTGELGYINDTYMGIKRFWGDDIIGNLFQNIGQLIGKWISEWINGWVADTVRFLTAFLRTFVLNPNIAVNGIQNGPGAGQADDISPYIRAAADVMYGIAVDLLLLLFILCIWKFWAEAAWRGGGGLMGSVGRLIFTAGLLLAWPTIYAFIIQITNEMIQAIYFNSADDIMRLDAAMASAVKGGLMAGAGLLAHAFAPIVGGAAGGLALGLVGEIVAFAGLVIYLIIGGILIAQLIYILVLKAIQTALLTAQYMFGPIFLVFFATPDTENVATGYVKSFVEVSLWTFVWVGLLKIMVIILFSDFNPWGKIIMAIGVLQLMIQVPSFLARAQISPMSDFVSAGLITGGLLGMGKALATKGGDLMDRFAKWRGSLQDGGARGPQQTQSVKMNGLPHAPQDPDAYNKIQNAAKGDLNNGNKPGDKDKNKQEQNPNGQNLKPLTEADRKKQEEEEKKKKMQGQGLPEQAKAVTGADGTTTAVPPGKKDAMTEGLKNGVKGGLAAAGIGAVLAGAQASDAQKKNTTGTNADQAARDRANEMAAMFGLDTSGNQDPNKQGQQGQKPMTEKEKEEAEKAKAAAAQLGGAGAKLQVQDKTKAGETKKEEKKNENAVPVLPPASGIPGAKKGEGVVPPLNAVGPDGRPLKVTEKGDGTGNDKGVNQVEAEQKNETEAAGLGVQRDTNLRVNQTDDKKGVAGKTGEPKLTTDAKDLTGKNAGQQRTATGAVVPPLTPPKGDAANAGANQGQNLNNGKTTETLQGGPEQQATGTQEHEQVVSLGQGVNGQGINLRVTQTPVNASGRTPVTQNAQVVPPSRPAGTMGQQTASPISGAAAHLGQNTAAAATQGNPDVTTMNVPEALQDIAGPGKVDPFTAFDHSGYGGVAPNIMAKLIRTYDGVSMGKSPDGQATIVGSPRGVAHVRFGANATQEQKAMQIASAGYAQTMTDDAEAFDAARQSAIDSGADQPKGFADRVAGNWLQYKGSSWRETYRAKRQFQQAMFSEAVSGAQAYVTGDEAGANAFTDHLRTRFGDMTPEKQAWMMHTLTDNTSPESGFGTARWPATDALVQANIGIDPFNRAAMARVLGTNIPVWQRPIAAKGIANYMRGVVDERATPDTSNEERAAMAGGLTGKLSPAIVDACATIQQFDAAPETTLKNPNFVNAVAIRGASYARDPNVQNPMRQAYDEEMLKSRMFGGGGSTVTTQVSGSIINGGGGGGDNGGGYSRVVDLPPPTDGGGGMGGAQFSGSFNVPPQRGTTQQNLTYRVNPGQSRGVSNGAVPNLTAESMQGRTETQVNIVNPQGANQVVNFEAEALVQQSNSALPPVINQGLIPRVPTNTVNVVNVKLRHQQGNVNGQNISMSVNGETQGASDVRIGRVTESGNNGPQVIQSDATVEVLHNGGGDNSGAIQQAVSSVAQTAPAALPPGVDIFVEMQQSGFTDAQRRDPNIVAGASQIYNASGGDRQAMVTAALTARALGSDSGNFGMKSVQVVQTMIDAGWKPNQISAHDIHIAEMIVDHGGDTGAGQGGGYPTPQYVRAISDHPEYRQTPPIGSGMSHAQLKQNNMNVVNQLAQQRYAQRTQQGGVDGYPRLGGPGGGRF